MIERRTHVIARGEDHPDWAGRVLWFEDGMGVKVHYRDMERVIKSAGVADNCVVRLVGCKATLELVDGRWLLARLELP